MFGFDVLVESAYLSGKNTQDMTLFRHKLLPLRGFCAMHLTDNIEQNTTIQ